MYVKSLVLDLFICNSCIWSNIIHRFYYILLIVVFFSTLAYSIENYATYRLVGQEWTIESGNRVLKCLYHYDMINKTIIIKYKYPCPNKIIDKIKK